MPGCHLCGGKLSEIEAFSRLQRVTSDSRPWPAGGRLASCDHCGTLQKPADTAFQTEIDEIYRTYRIYYQSLGEEQQVFSGGAGAPRSLELLQRVCSRLQLADAGRMLDVGCGNGGLLRSFSKLMPRWRLAGNELSDTHRDAIECIPGVEALYVGDLSAVPGRFDIITMLHSLEHFIAPGEFLGDLASYFAEGGRLIVEVPDFRQNPFDLLIADHVTHFSQPTLSTTLASAGYRLQFLTDDWIAKEISAIAVPNAPAVPMRKCNGDDGALAQSAIAKLLAVAEEAAILAASGALGVFGTSNAATWLAAELSARGLSAAFFVDEDKNRIGQNHMGAPVISPADLPEGVRVFVPLAPAPARKLVERLGSTAFVLPAALRAPE